MGPIIHSFSSNYNMAVHRASRYSVRFRIGMASTRRTVQANATTVSKPALPVNHAPLVKTRISPSSTTTMEIPRNFKSTPTTLMDDAHAHAPKADTKPDVGTVTTDTALTLSTLQALAHQHLLESQTICADMGPKSPELYLLGPFKIIKNHEGMTIGAFRQDTALCQLIDSALLSQGVKEGTGNLPTTQAGLDDDDDDAIPALIIEDNSAIHQLSDMMRVLTLYHAEELGATDRAVGTVGYAASFLHAATISPAVEDPTTPLFDRPSKSWEALRQQNEMGNFPMFMDGDENTDSRTDTKVVSHPALGDGTLVGTPGITEGAEEAIHAAILIGTSDMEKVSHGGVEVDMMEDVGQTNGVSAMAARQPAAETIEETGEAMDLAEDPVQQMTHSDGRAPMGALTPASTHPGIAYASKGDLVGQEPLSHATALVTPFSSGVPNWTLAMETEPTAGSIPSGPTAVTYHSITTPTETSPMLIEPTIACDAKDTIYITSPAPTVSGAKEVLGGSAEQYPVMDRNVTTSTAATAVAPTTHTILPLAPVAAVNPGLQPSVLRGHLNRSRPGQESFIHRNLQFTRVGEPAPRRLGSMVPSDDDTTDSEDHPTDFDTLRPTAPYQTTSASPPPVHNKIRTIEAVAVTSTTTNVPLPPHVIHSSQISQRSPVRKHLDRPIPGQMDRNRRHVQFMVVGKPAPSRFISITASDEDLEERQDAADDMGGTEIDGAGPSSTTPDANTPPTAANSFSGSGIINTTSMSVPVDGNPHIGTPVVGRKRRREESADVADEENAHDFKRPSKKLRTAPSSASTANSGHAAVLTPINHVNMQVTTPVAGPSTTPTGAVKRRRDNEEEGLGDDVMIYPALDPLVLTSEYRTKRARREVV
ncbi:hypothetical protein FRB94_013201 [Tulasnella sp. JGI-2019a]|nr:hypothetical protein FRB93_011806 [Tulasnella sp. JGI-2019a]KAG9008477.1 hypothetical protein FRB94_013201 [Tulasnella sp. JGI-2019a]